MIGKRKFKSPKVAEKRRKARLIKSGLLLLLLVFIIGGISYLSRLDRINIQEIKITGNSVTETEEIEAVAEKHLAGAYWGLFSKSNFLIYPERKIKEELLKDIKRIKEVDVSTDDFQRLFIQVKERGPQAMWCRDEVSAQEEKDEECFFLDQTGLVYSRAPKFSDNVFLKYYGFIEDSPVGKNFLTKESFQSLSALTNILEQFLGKISSISIDGNDDFQVNFIEGGQILFNLDQDFNQLATDLDSILSEDALKEALLDEDIALDYIDLRFGNKVYYKLVE